MEYNDDGGKLPHAVGQHGDQTEQRHGMSLRAVNIKEKQKRQKKSSDDQQRTDLAHPCAGSNPNNTTSQDRTQYALFMYGSFAEGQFFQYV